MVRIKILLKYLTNIIVNDIMKSHLFTLLLVAVMMVAGLYLIFSDPSGWNERETPEKQAESFLDKLEISHSAISCRKYNYVVAYCSANIAGKLD